MWDLDKGNALWMVVVQQKKTRPCGWFLFTKNQHTYHHLPIQEGFFQEPIPGRGMSFAGLGRPLPAPGTSFSERCPQLSGQFSGPVASRCSGRILPCGQKTRLKVTIHQPSKSHSKSPHKVDTAQTRLNVCAWVHQSDIHTNSLYIVVSRQATPTEFFCFSPVIRRPRDMQPLKRDPA